MPHLSWPEVRERAIRFAREHSHDHSEKSEKQTFWNEFFQVFGLRRASVASFEENVRNLKGHTSSIDLLWKGRLLVEHKSFGEDLASAKTQGFTYIEDLTREGRMDEVPRFVLVSDFARFVLYDLEPEEQLDLPMFKGRKWERQSFTLSEFPQHVRAFAFMLGQTRVRLHPEDPANEKAYARMCELHDALKSGGFAGHDLERLLVRVLFCLFAEDTGIFDPDVFTRFVRHQTRPDGSDVGAKLNELFDWLNRSEAEGPLDDTDPFDGFRYVNGGLFHERLGFPRFTSRMREALLYCCDFHWAKISPAVFGSLFQGVLADRVRRQQGAHYTSERDIMKVLRSLFLDDLRAELEQAKRDRSTRRRAVLEEFHGKLRALRFLDPACGCGNFLVLAYREIRNLEIEVAAEIHGKDQQLLDVRQVLRVDVDQFHGIELSDWPVRIAEVAMWLMDHQMNAKAAEVFGQTFDRLPLRASPHIIQGNALRIEWTEVLPREQCSYVLGNPPFVGKKEQTRDQKAEMLEVWRDEKGAGVLDYVTAWYVKGAAYLRGTAIRAAFVSTNSISQGEQVGILWRGLRRRSTLHIHFAHRSFAWMSEARGKAHVHVVIVGFGAIDVPGKIIYDYPQSNAEPLAIPATRINPYLADAVDVLLFKRGEPLCQVPRINYGSMANDKRKTDKGLGNLILNRPGRDDLLAETPDLEPYIRPFMGSEEFLNGTERWCLWLAEAPPGLLRRSPKLMGRIEAVREARLASGRPETVKLAGTPSLFGEIRQPATDYLLVPKVSSEDRPHMPLGFLPPTVIANGSSLIIPDASEYDFGVLSSMMHMAWMRYTGGRLESRYQYSSQIVYNNFPWPSPSAEQRALVVAKAQAVLHARAPHLPPRGMSTFADLYDPLAMPAALGRAHVELDRAVERCYRQEAFQNDRERVEYLFGQYEKMIAPLLPATPRSRGSRVSRTPRPASPRRARTPGLRATGEES